MNRLHRSTELNPGDLVQGLDDLQRGPEIQLLLIASGEAAVGPLARFLLKLPGPHPQPRMLAAEALGCIGGDRAALALIAALRARDLRALPPAVRLAEEAVRNCVARELGRLGASGAIEPLLEALRHDHLIEAGVALLRFREPRAAPLLVECLGDSFIAERAADTLTRFGREAVPALIDGLSRAATRDGVETPASIDRRMRCARVLGEIAEARAVPVLVQHLRDPVAAVRVRAALALTRSPSREVSDITAALIEGLCGPDPVVAEESSDALASFGASVIPALVWVLVDGPRSTSDRAGPSTSLRNVARTLGRMGAAGEEALSALAQHPDVLVRGLAIANLGVATDAGALVLTRALGDPDARVRRTAAARLKQVRDGRAGRGRPDPAA